MQQPFAPPHDARLPRTWRRSFEISSPLLNSLALTAASCLFVGLVYGALLFVFQPPNATLGSFVTWVQGTLAQHRTWGLGQGLIAWFGPSLDALEGPTFGLSPVSMVLVLFFCFLIAGLVFRATQRAWSYMGYDQRLRWWRWLIGALGLLVWPFACLVIRQFMEAPLIASFGSHWILGTFFWFLTAWLSYAGFHLWASPPHLAFRALGLGGLVSAVAFVVFTNTLQVLVLVRLPVGLIAQSLGFVTWLFFFWFSFWLGMLVLSRYTSAKPQLANADMANRLRLAFSVLSFLSGRPIKTGGGDHTTQEIYTGIGQSRRNTLVALEFLTEKAYVKSRRKWFGSPIGSWSLSRSLDEVPMRRVLGDLRASLQTGARRPAQADSGAKGLDALIGLEREWANQSIAQFLAWPGLASSQNDSGSIEREKADQRRPTIQPVNLAAEAQAGEHANLMAAKPDLMVQLEHNQRPWFEPEVFSEAFHPEAFQQPLNEASERSRRELLTSEDPKVNATDQALMGEIRSAISKVRQSGEGVFETKVAAELNTNSGEDIEAIIRKLTPS